MSANGFDPQLYADFLDEAMDSLAPLDRLVLSVSEGGARSDVVASLFRPIHSLKGNAGIFRLMQIKRLAHAMENILDALRQGKRGTIPVEPMLEGLDALRRGISEARRHDEPVDDPAVEALVETLLALERKPSQTRADGAGEPEELVQLRSLLSHPMEKALPSEAASEISRLVAELSGKCLPRGEAETALAKCRESLETILPVLGFDPVLRDILHEALAPLGGASGWTGPGRPPAAPSRPAPDAAAGAVERTMRVPEKSIDAFLGYVGELVVVEEVFQHLNRLIHERSGFDVEVFARRLRQNTDTFSSLSRSLRESILQLRRLPARMVLQKVPRLAHDVADKSGKRVRVEIVGEEISVDKSHLDLLDAPLTHLVNNAVDHGIESPGLRASRGKPVEGLVRLALRETEGFFVLEISDDGGGLDLAALQRKGEEMGLVAKGASLEQSQLVPLLFHPGLSTAKEVSETSGRGVGMDVVRRQIQEAGGRIEVETKEGEGSLFRIVLPHTVQTQIIEGFRVRVGDGTFLFPLGLVGEVFPYDRKRRVELPQVGGALNHGDHVLPLVSLDRVLAGSAEESEEATVVVLALGSGRAAFLVDEALGIHKTVVKPLEGLGKVEGMYEGVGMMGDGSMSLILGATGLESLVREAGAGSSQGRR